mgnify:CR=1 FL=1
MCWIMCFKGVLTNFPRYVLIVRYGMSEGAKTYGLIRRGGLCSAHELNLLHCVNLYEIPAVKPNKSAMNLYVENGEV